MNLCSFLTKPRSRERTLFIFVGVIFVGMGLLQISRQQWTVAAFLGAGGIAVCAAGTFLPEASLRGLGILAILVNVVAAVVALISGVNI